MAVDLAEPERDHPRPVAAECYGDIARTLEALAARRPGRTARRWLEHLRGIETAKREAEREQLADDRSPLHPMRVYAELAQVLDRDAIVIGDGGDFVSYAGRVVDSYAPGCWLDPGPFGCLGSGPGYALAAKLAHPGRQVVLLLGDGAFGFSGMEFDTLARHGVGVVGVMGNNGIWGLEKHPMEFLYGYSVAADLRPETRYDEVVRALGGHGELVRDARRAAARAGARAGGDRTGARQRAHRPVGGLPALSESGLNVKPPAAGAGGFKMAPSGRAGVRAFGGLIGWPGRREAPMMRQSPGPMRRRDGGGRHDRPFRRVGVSRGKSKFAIEQLSRERPSFLRCCRGRRPTGCPARRPRPRRARTRQRPGAGSSRRRRSWARERGRGP